MDDEVCSTLTRVALAGDGIVLGIGIGALAFRTWIKYRSHAKALKCMEEAPQLPLNALGSWLELCKSSNPSHQEQQQQERQIVFVRGMVSSETPITAQNADEKGVIVERSQTYLYSEWRGLFGWGSEWRAIFNWSSLKEQISSSTRKVPFVLTDNDGDYVHVNMDDSRHPLPLVTVYHQLQVVPRSSSTFLQALFGRRYPVGVIDEEKLLPLGKEITAVGIVTTTPEGDFVIRPWYHLPRFLTEFDREQLLDDISIGTDVLFYGSVIFTGVAIAVLSYALFRNWTKWNVWRRQRARDAEAERQDADEQQGDEDNIPDGELCVICLQRRRRAAFVACGHRVCCMACARRIGSNALSKCPVCREVITGVIRIYDT